MNDIQISGTIFSPREFGKKKMFRLAFYNGKTPSGDYKKDGYIDCKITSVTKINNVEIKELERVELQGYLTCDYWEYQGKKYSQLTIVVNEIGKDYKKKQQDESRYKEWDLTEVPEEKLADDLPNDFVPF